MDRRKNRRLTYPYIDAVSAQTVEFFGNKRNVVVFLNEIVKQGGEMLAADALEYEWLDIKGLLGTDAAFRKLVEEQKVSIAQKAEEFLCNRSMLGFEEIVEEHGEVVKKSRKFNDKILLDYVKANNPKYRKEAADNEIPAIEIRRFEVPAKGGGQATG